jgi:NitT/TauT family transport system ATP-binding protein
LNGKLVAINNISVSFGKDQVLKGFNLDIFEGDFISIIGQSGVGKSTILNVIAGNVIPNEGSISFSADHEITTTIVFQEYNRTLFPWYTVEDNLKIIRSDTLPAEIEEHLHLVGLENHRKKYPWQLSGGMQQRVVLARALMLKPRLLLLDEPFGSLDYNLKDELEDEVFALYKKMNLTVVHVTHDIESALFLSNKICFIEPGGISFKNFEFSHDEFRDKAIIKTSEKYKKLHNLIKCEEV